ncbi:MAG TPA: hypothetical protein VHR18_10695, partial [Solirubrobacterales bacterium]|nr:hypothetical protein [Solirubrobacterales bacterium]
KIKNGAVDGAKVKDGSLTGADINLGTLGTVPSATNAAKAAKTEQIANVFFAGNPGPAKKTVLNLGGLTITAECDGEVQLEATTSVAHSFIAFYTPQDQDTDVNLDFSPGESFDADDGHDEGGDLDLYTLRYSRPDGVNVIVELQDVDSGEIVFPGTPQAAECYLGGIAFTS